MIYQHYFQDKIDLPKSADINKVLCIIEGKSELLFIKKTHDLHSKYEISSTEFIAEYIELSWGKNPINWFNKEKLNFQGGNIQGSLTPMPVLESLYKENIAYYKAVLIMFDADLDEESLVYNESKQLLTGSKSLIFYADPCFEKEVIALTFNDQSQIYIDQNYQVLDGSKCRWYKKNWKSIPKENRFLKSQSGESLLKYLKKDDLRGKNPKVDKLVNFILENINKTAKDQSLRE